MKILRYLLPATISLLIATNVAAQDLKVTAKDKISAFKDVKMNAYTNELNNRISSFIKDNFA